MGSGREEEEKSDYAQYLIALTYSGFNTVIFHSSCSVHKGSLGKACHWTWLSVAANAKSKSGAAEEVRWPQKHIFGVTAAQRTAPYFGLKKSWFGSWWSKMRQPSNRKNAHTIGGGQYRARYFCSLHVISMVMKANIVIISFYFLSASPCVP